MYILSSILPSDASTEYWKVVRPEWFYNRLAVSDLSASLRGAILEDFKPFVLSPYRPKDKRYNHALFTGRRDELVDAASDRHTIIVGPREIGKTWLCNYLLNEIRKNSIRRGKRRTAALIDCAATYDEANFWKELVSSLGYDKTNVMPGHRHRVNYADRRRPIELPDYELLKRLMQSSDANAVIMLDEVDSIIQADRKNNYRLFKHLQGLCESVSGKITVIMSGYEVVRNAFTEDRFPLNSSRSDLVHLKPFDIAEVAQLVATPMSRIGITVDGPEVVHQRLLTAVAGMPKLVQEVCYLLLHEDSVIRSRKVTLKDLNTVLKSDVITSGLSYFYQQVRDDLAKLLVMMTLERLGDQSGGVVTKDFFAQEIMRRRIMVGDNRLTNALGLLELYGVFSKSGIGDYTISSTILYEYLYEQFGADRRKLAATMQFLIYGLMHNTQ